MNLEDHKQPGCSNVPSLDFMYITNNPIVAQAIQKEGIKRIWIDLETLGKQERQAGINSVKSDHSIDDIKIIRPLISTSELLVRVNPINSGSKVELEKVISNGADIIMLPMFKTKKEVEMFLDIIAGRTKTTLLFETKEAIEIIDDILRLGGIDEMHVGLNDLHLSYGMTFMFELLANGMVEKICNITRKYNILYGFGGIAKIGEGLLPAECIIAEHYRLGSTRAILSRSFCDNQMTSDETLWINEFSEGIAKIRDYEKTLLYKKELFFDENKKRIQKTVSDIVRTIKEKSKKS